MIDLLFRQGSGLASDAIEWISSGDFTHVDAVVPVGGVAGIPWPGGYLVGERSDSVGGQPPGLHCRPPNYEQAKLLVKFHLPALPEQETAFWAMMYSQDGKEYDKKGILGFAFNKDLHTMGLYFCSAVILDGLQSADWGPPLYSPFWRIPPVGLSNLVAFRGAWWEAVQHA